MTKDVPRSERQKLSVLVACQRTEEASMEERNVHGKPSATRPLRRPPPPPHPSHPFPFLQAKSHKPPPPSISGARLAYVAVTWPKKPMKEAKASVAATGSPGKSELNLVLAST